MPFRSIQTEDLPDLFEIRIATWHNSNGHEEMTQMGITPDAVRQMLLNSHRGWLCEVDGRKVDFSMVNKKPPYPFAVPDHSRSPNRTKEQGTS